MAGHAGCDRGLSNAQVLVKVDTVCRTFKLHPRVLGDPCIERPASLAFGHGPRASRCAALRKEHEFGDSGDAVDFDLHQDCIYFDYPDLLTPAIVLKLGCINRGNRQ